MSCLTYYNLGTFSKVHSHVSIFNGRFDGFIWSSVFLWGSDRLLRLCRILVFNRQLWGTHATATYNPNSDMIRLTIPYSTSVYRPKPGTYYYLHVVNDIRFWESHPFTVAATTTCYHDPRNIKHSNRGTLISTDEVSLLPQGEPRTPSAVLCGESLEKPQVAMTFLLRPYDSFTGRLRDMAAATWPLPASLRVLVDGPYGHMQRFDYFDHLLFIVGGSGIVVPLSYLESFSKHIPRPKTVHVVWAAREFEFTAEVIRGEFSHSLDGGKLSLDVYITKDERCTRNSQSSGWPKEVRMLSDRPNVRDEVESASRRFDGENLAVVACGPAKMADDARRAVVDMLGSRNSRIEYFEEAFRW